jgi:hypothetical protein
MLGKFKKVYYEMPGVGKVSDGRTPKRVIVLDLSQSPNGVAIPKANMEKRALHDF